MTVTVTRTADLRLDVVTPGLFVGIPSSYAMLVTNKTATATAGPITITDVLPAGLRYRDYVGPGWSCGAVGQTVTCTFARPLPGRSFAVLALVVDVTAPRGTVITNTVRLTPLDAVPADNTVTIRSTVRRL